MRTLFTSRRPLQRAENIKAIYDAYDGEKALIPKARFDEVNAANLIVTSMPEIIENKDLNLLRIEVVL